MKIKFDLTTMEPGAARGLVAMLHAAFGDAVLPAAPRYGGKLKDALAQSAQMPPWAKEGDPLAPDGYPVTEDDGPGPFPTLEPKPAQQPAHGPRGPYEVDSAGTPWDERIHSSSKGTNKDGTWTRRRNTPDEVFDAVMGELKAGAGNASSPAPAPTSDAPTANEAFGDPKAPPPPPPAPAAPPPPPPAAADGAPVTLASLMIKVTKAQALGQITKETVTEFLGAAGVGSVAQLNGNAEGLELVNNLVDQHLNG